MIKFYFVKLIMKNRLKKSSKECYMINKMSLMKKRKKKKVEKLKLTLSRKFQKTCKAKFLAIKQKS